ncbi:MAG: ABC transporter permease [Spirochaetaceae bacterium]|nr:MAG: ABC transporter permease [Spirochaetaceae bacterium]
MRFGKLTGVPRTGSITKNDVLQFLMKGRAFVALILVFAVFTLLAPGFLSVANLIIISKHVAIIAILAIGMTFVILSGGIDLSVGSIVGLSAMIAGGLINEGIEFSRLGVIVYPSIWMVIAITLLAGTVMGLINGLTITRFNVYPFIATLGMLYVARGLAGLRNNGRTFANLVGRPELNNTGFEQLGAGTLLGIPYSIWIMALFAIVAYFVTMRLPFGRHVYALGGNRRASQLSGVRVARTETLVYMVSGFCSAMVGLIIASQLVAAHPATGVTDELTAIAAVVLGGTSLMGGRGGVAGTIIGAFVIGTLVDGLVVMGFSSFLQNIIKGLVIVAAVIIDQAQIRMQERIALQSQEARAARA